MPHGHIYFSQHIGISSISYVVLCFAACPLGEFKCNVGGLFSVDNCVPLSNVCDGIDDCANRFDELYCAGTYHDILYIDVDYSHY